MNRLRKIRSSMSKNVIGGLVAMLLLFGMIVCFIGYSCIISAFEKEYSSVTYHMADSAVAYVNGNHIDQYLEGETAGGVFRYKATPGNLL